MRQILAAAMGLAILGIGLSVVRGLMRRASPVATREPESLPEGIRVVFLCETCGTEVLLLSRGTDVPPRHCGEPMTRRDEFAPE